MRTKACPDCGFGASLNARACAKCGRFFGDAAPLAVRHWIRDHARKVRAEHPDLSLEDLRKHLEEHLLHDHGLQRAIEEDPDPARWVAVSGDLLSRARELLRELWRALGGEDPETVRQISWAIDEVMEELEPRT